ncbi:MAG: hypothetical protein FIA94_00425 [Nitrospirae bacterium]|nr:hypothetical protein [Nitrospirota bacterium]
MKAALIFCVFMVAVLAALPASAQLVLYDDFQGKVIDPGKWVGRGVSDTGVASLDHARFILVDPIFGLKWLDIFNRSYAAQSSDTGRSTAFNRLQFINGSGITEIVATVMIRKVQATTCSSNAAVTNPQARIGGMYFNTGATPVDQTNDVFAFITIGRPSDSVNPKYELDVTGVVAICNDATCSTNTPIGNVDVGSALLNFPVRLRIAWDQANNRFIFQRGKAPEVYVNNTATVGGPPGTGSGDGNKRLEVNHQIPNCTSLPRPMSFIDAYFDNIKVNQIP